MIFEKMKEPETKAAFLEKRLSAVNSNPAEVRLMAEYIWTERFDADLQRLMDGDFFFDPPNLILLRKGQSNRKRKVYRFSDENKTILQYLTYMLMEQYDERFPDSLYSFRKNRPTGTLYTEIRRCDPNREKYVVKADIHSFGESIDTDILSGKLRDWFADEPQVCSFLIWLVTRNVFYRNGSLETGFTSVMPGNPTVAFLQNIYLLDVDLYLKENALVSSRYTDDICAIVDDAESAERIMRRIREIAKMLKLTINEEKTGIIPPGMDYDLLGIKFAPGYTDISDNTYRKVTSRIRHRANRIGWKVKNGVILRDTGLAWMAAAIQRYFGGTGKDGYVSWMDKFFPYITSIDRLKRLDRLSQESLRYVATGRRTNAKFRFRYHEIRSLGYVPLVREYYERCEASGSPRRKKQSLPDKSNQNDSVIPEKE